LGTERVTCDWDTTGTSSAARAHSVAMDSAITAERRRRVCLLETKYWLTGLFMARRWIILTIMVWYLTYFCFASAYQNIDIKKPAACAAG
jgi:hypothetical protein